LQCVASYVKNETFAKRPLLPPAIGGMYPMSGICQQAQHFARSEAIAGSIFQRSRIYNEKEAKNRELINET